VGPPRLGEAGIIIHPEPFALSGVEESRRRTCLVKELGEVGLDGLFLLCSGQTAHPREGFDANHFTRPTSQTRLRVH